MLAPPSLVVPYRLPSSPCTKPAGGFPPLVPSKLSSLVKVTGRGSLCAGDTIAVAAQNRQSCRHKMPSLFRHPAARVALRRPL